MKKAFLIILDGWGLGADPDVDAIHQARTKYFDLLMSDHPHATLVTHGLEVGLPEGQMGNSEVGHLNIGAGRIVYQELARINKAIADKTLASMAALSEAIQYVKKKKKRLHLIGLLSDGGVHSHINHLKALCDIATDEEIPEVFIHAFTDGRDTAPTDGVKYVEDLLSHIKDSQVQLATVCGRYYAMDRDLRWERIKLAYDMLVHTKGLRSTDIIGTLNDSYESGVTDEFIKPIVLSPEGKIEAGDAVVFFNFRTDRPRQIVRALTQEDFDQYDMKTLPLHFVTMVNYDSEFRGINVIYEKENLNGTLGEILAKAGLSQVRIAETEKYPHVTFFFNGGREEPYPNEDRIMIPSPKVATYDLAPEMSANEVTTAICERIQQNPPDFICLNYANADMVGHTGDFDAARKACEVVDKCLEQVVETALSHEYEVIIIADHGNSDFMINEDGTPHTAHTTNPVPIIYVSKDEKNRAIRDGKLADVAPTILDLMGVNKSEQMTGASLLTFN